RPANRHRLRPADITVDQRRPHIATTVALHPTVAGKRETIQLLAEVLHHIVAFRLTMHQHIDTELFLKCDDLTNLILEEGFVLLLCDLALVELATLDAKFRFLRE